LLDLDRLVFLTDGVFAITLTLLVLDLKLPANNARALGETLRELLPRLAICLFAFTNIVNQWIIQDRTFRRVRHGDSNLITLSLANL
jgi:uncharacterized membrane protein